MLSKYDDNINTIILELTRLEISLVCQMVHVYLLQDPDTKPLGLKLAESLKNQTDCYVDSPSLMGVFDSALNAPTKAVTIKECYLDVYDKFYENFNR